MVLLDQHSHELLASILAVQLLLDDSLVVLKDEELEKELWSEFLFTVEGIDGEMGELLAEVWTGAMIVGEVLVQIREVRGAQ